MTIDLVIFDCDGVLIDSEPASSRVLSRALADAGVSITPAEVHHRFTGFAANDARRIMADELGVSDVDGVFSAFGAALYDEFGRSLQPMPGIASLVADLPRQKCVASNSTMERLEKSLGLFSMWQDFAPHVYSAEMVARPKPAPDLFFLCAETFGVDPENCLVIDDSPHGIEGAVAAGMKAIGFVDPADPRAGRHEILSRAGAVTTVTAASGLSRALEAMFSASALRTHHAAVAIPSRA